MIRGAFSDEKLTNENAAKNAFEQRVKETKQKAIDENKKNAEKYGNSVTQDVDDEGNLVGIGSSTQEKTLAGDGDSITIEEVKRELFEGDNIVVGETDHGKSQLISGPFKNTDADTE